MAPKKPLRTNKDLVELTERCLICKRVKPYNTICSYCKIKKAYDHIDHKPSKKSSQDASD